MDPSGVEAPCRSRRTRGPCPASDDPLWGRRLTKGKHFCHVLRFRWTLVRSKGEARFLLVRFRVFQTSPCGVEATRERFPAPWVWKFQMGPWGVEAAHSASSGSTRIVPDGPFWDRSTIRSACVMGSGAVLDGPLSGRNEMESLAQLSRPSGRVVFGAVVIGELFHDVAEFALRIEYRVEYRSVLPTPSHGTASLASQHSWSRHSQGADLYLVKCWTLNEPGLSQRDLSYWDINTRTAQPRSDARPKSQVRSNGLVFRAREGRGPIQHARDTNDWPLLSRVRPRLRGKVPAKDPLRSSPRWSIPRVRMRRVRWSVPRSVRSQVLFYILSAGCQRGNREGFDQLWSMRNGVRVLSLSERRNVLFGLCRGRWLALSTITQ